MRLKEIFKNKFANLMTNQTFQVVITVMFILLALYLVYRYVLSAIPN